MIFYCLMYHGRVRRGEGARMTQIGLREGKTGQGRKMRRTAGWGEERRVCTRVPVVCFSVFFCANSERL
ncbi:hypothetical protein B0H17DRAFT_1053952 [Mycena rosella]|uniref:Uncharacterized protein n=1 Tax=Mycena rosella TaxID=1033263 RepID=A0AAD7DPP4_MYCRO|nr:hypothetical protein B0H17DRAFT_1053952 [Mycena rosella]